MAMRISLTNNLTAEGVRWHMIERGRILTGGTAKTELQARAAAIKVIKRLKIAGPSTASASFIDLGLKLLRLRCCSTLYDCCC